MTLTPWHLPLADHPYLRRGCPAPDPAARDRQMVAKLEALRAELGDTPELLEAIAWHQSRVDAVDRRPPA